MEDWNLNQLIGKAGTVHIEGIRVVCRNRVTGQSEPITAYQLRKAASDCRSLASAIEAKDGPSSIVEDLQDKAGVLQWASDRPSTVHDLSRKVYEREHGNTTQSPNSEYDPGIQCPFEERQDNRACWGCHVPKMVFGRVREAYRRGDR